jgi:hypothetical protein
MSVTKITLKNVSNYSKIGMIPHIGKYVPRILKQSSLPIDVELEDSETLEVFPAQLISVLCFQNEIPEICSLLVTGDFPNNSTDELLARNNVLHTSNLGFYVYKFCPKK